MVVGKGLALTEIHNDIHQNLLQQIELFFSHREVFAFIPVIEMVYIQHTFTLWLTFGKVTLEISVAIDVDI